MQRRSIFDIFYYRSAGRAGCCRSGAVTPRPAAGALMTTHVARDARVIPSGVERIRGRRVPKRFLLVLVLLCISLRGCATIRTTDPPRSATEQFLMSVATRKAVDQLSAEALRDRAVYVDTTYLISSAYPTPENLFYVAELRNKLLVAGVRLAEKREKAQIVLEVRSGGIGIDRLEYLLGLPSIYLTGGTSKTTTGASAPIATPELAIVKSTKQYGFASAAFVAYWADTGELVASSGPFVGRTLREDWWIFGFGPRTVGDIPPTEK